MSYDVKQLKETEDFIRETMRDVFQQEVPPERLREAAEKFCKSLPKLKKAAA